MIENNEIQSQENPNNNNVKVRNESDSKINHENDFTLHNESDFQISNQIEDKLRNENEFQMRHQKEFMENDENEYINIKDKLKEFNYSEYKETLKIYKIFSLVEDTLTGDKIIPKELNSVFNHSHKLNTLKHSGFFGPMNKINELLKEITKNYNPLEISLNDNEKAAIYFLIKEEIGFWFLFPTDNFFSEHLSKENGVVTMFRYLQDICPKIILLFSPELINNFDKIERNPFFDCNENPIFEFEMKEKSIKNLSIDKVKYDSSQIEKYDEKKSQLNFNNSQTGSICFITSISPCLIEERNILKNCMSALDSYYLKDEVEVDLNFVLNNYLSSYVNIDNLLSTIDDFEAEFYKNNELLQHHIIKKVRDILYSKNYYIVPKYSYTMKISEQDFEDLFYDCVKTLKTEILKYLYQNIRLSQKDLRVNIINSIFFFIKNVIVEYYWDKDKNEIMKQIRDENFIKTLDKLLTKYFESYNSFHEKMKIRISNLLKDFKKNNNSTLLEILFSRYTSNMSNDGILRHITITQDPTIDKLCLSQREINEILEIQIENDPKNFIQEFTMYETKSKQAFLLWIKKKQNNKGCSLWLISGKNKKKLMSWTESNRYFHYNSETELVTLYNSKEKEISIFKIDFYGNLGKTETKITLNHSELNDNIISISCNLIKLYLIDLNGSVFCYNFKSNYMEKLTIRQRVSNGEIIKLPLLNFEKGQKYEDVYTFYNDNYFILKCSSFIDIYDTNIQLVKSIPIVNFIGMKIFYDHINEYLIIVQKSEDIALVFGNLASKDILCQLTNNKNNMKLRGNPILDVIYISDYKYGPFSSFIGAPKSNFYVNYIKDSNNEDFMKLIYDYGEVMEQMFSNVKYLSNEDIFTTIVKENESTSNTYTILLTRTPIHIASIDYGILIPLINGQFHNVKFLQKRTSCEKEASKIKFDYLEQFILQNQSEKIKVISIIGAQSGGKSYLLNRLFGTRFFVASTRCTDGIWMSYCKLSNTSLLILDCEGLFSSRRNENEEAKLITLLAAVSDITILNQDLSFNRKLQEFLNKLSKTVIRLKGEKLFKGSLMICVRNIDKKENENTLKEFRRSFSENSNEYIKQLFGGRILFSPLVSYDNKRFDNEIKYLRDEILRKPSHWDNSQELLTYLKTIIIQLTVDDNSSSDQIVKKINLDSLKDQIIDYWKNLEDVESSIVLSESILIKLSQNSIVLKKIEEETEYIMDTMCNLYSNKFEKYEEENFCSFYQKVNVLMVEFFNHRYQLLLKYMDSLCEKYINIYPEECKELKIQIDSEISQKIAQFKICLQNCTHCNLICILKENHKNESQNLRIHYQEEKRKIENEISQLPENIKEEIKKREEIKEKIDSHEIELQIKQVQLENFKKIQFLKKEIDVLGKALEDYTKNLEETNLQLNELKINNNVSKDILIYKITTMKNNLKEKNIAFKELISSVKLVFNIDDEIQLFLAPEFLLSTLEMTNNWYLNEESIQLFYNEFSIIVHKDTESLKNVFLFNTKLRKYYEGKWEANIIQTKNIENEMQRIETINEIISNLNKDILNYHNEQKIYKSLLDEYNKLKTSYEREIEEMKNDFHINNEAIEKKLLELNEEISEKEINFNRMRTSMEKDKILQFINKSIQDIKSINLRKIKINEEIDTANSLYNSENSTGVEDLQEFLKMNDSELERKQALIKRKIQTIIGDDYRFEKEKIKFMEDLDKIKRTIDLKSINKLIVQLQEVEIEMNFIRENCRIYFNETNLFTYFTEILLKVDSQVSINNIVSLSYIKENRIESMSPELLLKLKDLLLNFTSFIENEDDNTFGLSLEKYILIFESKNENLNHYKNFIKELDDCEKKVTMQSFKLKAKFCSLEDEIDNTEQIMKKFDLSTKVINLLQVIYHEIEALLEQTRADPFDEIVNSIKSEKDFLEQQIFETMQNMVKCEDEKEIELLENLNTTNTLMKDQLETKLKFIHDNKIQISEFLDIVSNLYIDNSSALWKEILNFDLSIILFFNRILSEKIALEINKQIDLYVENSNIKNKIIIEQQSNVIDNLKLELEQLNSVKNSKNNKFEKSLEEKINLVNQLQQPMMKQELTLINIDELETNLKIKINEKENIVITINIQKSKLEEDLKNLEICSKTIKFIEDNFNDADSMNKVLADILIIKEYNKLVTIADNLSKNKEDTEKKFINTNDQLTLLKKEEISDYVEEDVIKLETTLKELKEMVTYIAKYVDISEKKSNIEKEIHKIDTVIKESCTCKTDHKCVKDCFICKETKCMLPKNHKGIHLCEKKDHRCQEACEAFKECKRKCAREVTTEEHLHECGQNHQCENLCEYCHNYCTKGFGDHQKHLCNFNKCPHKCILCDNQCADNNHNHDELTTTFINKEGKTQKLHICSNTHHCTNKCSYEGVCSISYREEQKVWQYGDTQIPYKYLMPLPIKNACGIIIPKNKYMHSGECNCYTFHTCQCDQCIFLKDHKCKVQCPQCGSFCIHTNGHRDKHDVLHRNMEKCIFAMTDKEKVIKIEDDNSLAKEKAVKCFKVEDSAEPEICNLSCKRKGRGHYHLKECLGGEQCGEKIYFSNNCKHSPLKYFPNESLEYDLFLCEAYWNSFNFKNPVNEEDSRSFSLCNYYCKHKDHKDEKSFCQKFMWHTDSSLYKDHHFVCSHDSIQGIQVAFLLDITQSMEDYIKEAMSSINRIVEIINMGNTNIALEFAVVSYKDHVEDNITAEVVDIFNFGDDKGALNFIDSLKCEGGADECEAVVDGLFGINNLNWNLNPNVLKMTFMITDNPPHGREFYSENIHKISLFSFPELIPKTAKFFDLVILDLMIGSIEIKKDNFPDGCPCQKDYREIIKQIHEKEIKFFLIKYTSNVDKMVEIFNQFDLNIKILDVENEKIIKDTISTCFCGLLEDEELTIIK